ncbi:MAG: hypothetical protein GY756_22790 [bacterium]|nr:hypothetical protein [bacterium]
MKTKIKILSVALIFVVITSCKKEDETPPSTPPPPTPQTSIICDGNGKNTYYPLDSANTWNYKYSIMGASQSIAPSLYVQRFSNYGGKTYARIVDLSGWFGDRLLREDPVTHNIYYYSGNDNVEYLKVPSSPTLDQTWSIYNGTAEVTNLSASLTTSSCSYTGLLEITETASTVINLYYYKKGLGLVAILSPGFPSTETKLSSVSIK